MEEKYIITKKMLNDLENEAAFLANVGASYDVMGPVMMARRLKEVATIIMNIKKEVLKQPLNATLGDGKEGSK